MTIWEHCFWLEVEYCKANDRAVIEFKDVDKRVLDLAKTLEYTPPPSEDGDEVIVPCACGHRAERHEIEPPYPCHECGCKCFSHFPSEDSAS